MPLGREIGREPREEEHERRVAGELAKADARQLTMLQQAAEKLREVAPLLAENDDEDNAVLAEVVDDASAQADAMAAKAGAASSSSKSRPSAPRWP